LHQRTGQIFDKEIKPFSIKWCSLAQERMPHSWIQTMQAQTAINTIIHIHTHTRACTNTHTS